MVGYTPDYSQWTAAANVSNGSVVWPEPTYDKWLKSVVDCWMRVMGYHHTDNSPVVHFKPRRSPRGDKWAYAFAKWYRMHYTGEISECLHYALAMRHKCNVRTSGGSNPRPGAAYYTVQQLSDELNGYMYIEEYLRELDTEYNLSRWMLLRSDFPSPYGYYARKLIDAETPDAPQYESLWKDNKFNQYIRAVANAQTRVVLNGFIESKREERKMTRTKKRTKKGK